MTVSVLEGGQPRQKHHRPLLLIEVEVLIGARISVTNQTCFSLRFRRPHQAPVGLLRITELREGTSCFNGPHDAGKTTQLHCHHVSGLTSSDRLKRCADPASSNCIGGEGGRLDCGKKTCQRGKHTSQAMTLVSNIIQSRITQTHRRHEKKTRRTHEPECTTQSFVTRACQRVLSTTVA